MSRMKEIWSEQAQHDVEVSHLEYEIESRDFAIVELALTISHLKGQIKDMTQTISDLTVENIKLKHDSWTGKEVA